MANKDAAFGMKPVRMIGGAPYSGGTSRYRIAANYGTSIFQGDMVAQVTGGTVEVHADGGTVPIVGVFNGCQFTDPTTGEQVFQNFYPASTNASSLTIRMWFMKYKLMTRSLLLIFLATLILCTPAVAALKPASLVLSLT